MGIPVFLRRFAFSARPVMGAGAPEDLSGSVAHAPATHTPDVFASHALWVLSGAGFALGFGWLWFAPLRESWLPEFLRAGLFSGGVGLFVPLLCLGCILAGWRLRLGRVSAKRSLKPFAKLSAELSVKFSGEPSANPFAQPSGNPSAKPSREADSFDFRLGCLPHCVHALALALVAAALFGFGPVMPHAAAACMTFAVISLGMFWMSALLVLPAGRCLAAFIWACVLFSGLVVLQDEAAGETAAEAAEELLPAVFVAAWWAALALGWMLKQLRLASELARLKRPEPKRPRGRPPQRAAFAPAPEKPQSAPLSRIMVFSAVLVFLLIGLGRSGLRHALAGPYGHIPDFPWLGALLCAAGAALVLLVHVFRGRSGAVRPDRVPPALAAICAAFAVQGLGFLFPWEILPFIVHIVEGVVCGSILMLFAAAPAKMLLPAPAMQRSAGLRAAVVLGCAATFVCAGVVAGEGLHFFCAPYQNAGRLTAGWAGGVALVLAGLLGGMIHLGTSGRPGEADSGGNTLAALLTERERTIAGMVSQGYSNKAIAAELFISEDTVRFHLKHIYQKTGLRDREELRGLKTDSIMKKTTDKKNTMQGKS